MREELLRRGARAFSHAGAVFAWLAGRCFKSGGWLLDLRALIVSEHWLYEVTAWRCACGFEREPTDEERRVTGTMPVVSRCPSCNEEQLYAFVKASP